MEKKLLNLGEAAQRLKLSLPTVRRMARADLFGGLVRTKLGLRVDPAQLNEWILADIKKRSAR